MKVFIDTNVFLDYILSRQVGFVEANELFMLSANYQIDLILSDLTLSNVRYVTRRDFTVLTPSDFLAKYYPQQIS